MAPLREFFGAAIGRRRGFIVLAILLVVVFAIGFSSNFWMPLRLGYVLLFGLIAAFVWSRLNARGISIRMSASRERVQVGETIIERFEISNATRVPTLWAEIEEETDLPGHRPRFVTSLRGRGRRFWRLQTECRRRGLFQVGPVVVRTGDPFDIFRREVRFGRRRQVIVYPRAVDLPRYSVPPANLPGEGRFRRRTHYVTPNASGIRDYEPGDSVNRIHWKSTLRTGQLKVKTFELDPASHLWIVLDLLGQDHAGEGDAASVEYGVTAAASIARLFLAQNRTVGLMMFGDHFDVVEPDRGTQHLGRMLESLAVAQPVGDVSLSTLLYQQAARWGRHTTLIAITGSTDERWVGAVETLQRRGVQVAVVMLDLESFGGRGGGDEVAAELMARGVQTNIIREGDWLPAVLVGAVAGGSGRGGSPALAVATGGGG